MEQRKKKVSRGKVVLPTPKDLTPASYNPRKMSDKTKEALKRSIQEFEDISGITWNKRTKNIITGHHRWKTLIDAHGIENLEFRNLENDRYAVYTKDGIDTTFIVRTVDWDLKKEKAANIAANSGTLSGEFTVDLQDILSEIQDSYKDLFADLRFDELQLNVGEISDSDEWTSDIEAVDKIESNLDGIVSVIKLEVPQELRSEVFILLQGMINEHGYSNKIKVS